MSKVTRTDYDDYETLINEGLSQRQACKALGIKRGTMQYFLKTVVLPSQVEHVPVRSIADSVMRSLWKPFMNLQSSAPEPQSKKTILIIADTQCKSEESLDYMLWIGKYIADKRPDVIVHIGDHYDFPSLSSYDKGKSSAEGRRLHKDIEAGNLGFDHLNKYITNLEGYNPRKVFTVGNHEHRLDRYIDDNPELVGTLGVEKLPFSKYGWEVHPFLKPVEIEGIFFVHYLANPMNGKPYGGNAMNILKTVGRSFVVGHKQCLDIALRPTIDNKLQLGIVNGACYNHDEAYKGYQGNNHFRGITVLHEVADGFGLPCFVSLDFMKEKYYQDKTIDQ